LPTTRTIEYQGRKVEGELVDFEAGTESWNQYTLHDGSSLKIKTVLLEVVRLVNEFGPSGDPIYVFSAQQIVGTTVPDTLKKKA
jgi:hypothetical protein